MSRMQIAVVGCGHLGSIHARLLKSLDDVALVGVVDPVEAAPNASPPNARPPPGRTWTNCPNISMRL